MHESPAYMSNVCEYVLTIDSVCPGEVESGAVHHSVYHSAGEIESQSELVDIELRCCSCRRHGETARGSVVSLGGKRRVEMWRGYYVRTTFRKCSLLYTV